MGISTGRTWFLSFCLLLALNFTFAGKSEAIDRHRYEGEADLYSLLGIPTHADDAEIKKAFRAKAKELHPDKNKSRHSNEEFELLRFAMEVLSNPQKRMNYDACGFAGIDSGCQGKMKIKPKERRSASSSSAASASLSTQHCEECCSGAWGPDLQRQCSKVAPCNQIPRCATVA